MNMNTEKTLTTSFLSSREQPIVAIRCLVYNHEPYLRDCLEGFVKQQTTFPFVVIVHDDASTDNSAMIISEYARKYPSIIKPIYETDNQYSKKDGSLGRIMDTAVDQIAPTYIACCEGDDYWIDPLKLQKQVDILEDDYTLMAVCTDTSIVDNHGHLLNPKRGGVVKDNKEGRYTLRDFFKYSHQYPTASVLYRNAYKDELREKYNQTRNGFLGDWTLWICLHIYGDFYYINEAMVAYRINPTSVTHSNVDARRLGLAKANFKLIPAVANILPNEYQDIKENLTKDTAWMWFNLANAYKHQHQYVKMFCCLLVCCIKDPKLLYTKILNRK